MNILILKNMRLAFFYSNEGLAGFDYSKPDEFNPGIGGTHYQMILLIFYLSQRGYDISVYCYEDSTFPANVTKNTVKSYAELMHKVKDNADFLIMRAESDSKYWECINKCPVKIIFWGHNFYLSSMADFVARTNSIVANVFVGKQQYDRYIDHPIISKSTVIFNMQKDYIVSQKTHREKIVVYMGALIPSKGFLELAKLWKRILKKIPDAKLKVIGTGQVYSRHEKMGSLGIASESYERKFLKYLTDDTGAILESVEFMGLLGKEKFQVFEHAMVGVINPTARTEIFSVSIMEMATAMLPVVTLNKNGFPDSICNGKTGYLCSSLNDIENKIVYMLQHPDAARMMGQNAKEFIQSFQPADIIPCWVRLFDSINKNAKMKYLSPSKPLSNNMKFLRIGNRFLRNSLKLKMLPPIINIESILYKILH